MSSRATPPIGVLLCVAAVAVFAAPTLAFPADAPTGPRLVFAAIGTVLLVLGMIFVRREPAERSAAARAPRGRTTPRAPRKPTEK